MSSLLDDFRRNDFAGSAPGIVSGACAKAAVERGVPCCEAVDDDQLLLLGQCCVPVFLTARSCVLAVFLHMIATFQAVSGCHDKGPS